MQTTEHNQQPPAPGAVSQPPVGPEKLPGIRHIIAVGSGKGGVGKSTVSVNLALALQQLGARVGIVDADILGPSVPGMLGISTGEPPAQNPQGMMIPAERHGLKAVSMGMLTGDDNPAVLRGPMVGKYLKMFVGGERMCQELGVPFLGALPLDADVVTCGDEGRPIVVDHPQSVSAKVYEAWQSAPNSNHVMRYRLST